MKKQRSGADKQEAFFLAGNESIDINKEVNKRIYFWKLNEIPAFGQKQAFYSKEV